jgi:tetratricopeptide (TPR) repeat protein
VHDRSIALGNLGAVALGLGDYEHAIRAFEETIELQESLNDLRRVIINLGNLGECYVDLGAGEQGRARLERALTLADLIDAPILTAEALRNLSRIEAEEGRLDEALAQAQRACELSAAYHRTDLHSQALYTLGEIRLLRKEMDEAEQVGRALLTEAGTVNTHAASARLILGRCALARRDSQALPMLEEGLLEAQASFSKILILRFHAALSQVVDHPAIAQVHRRIALELTAQLTESLQDKTLRQAFRRSALVRTLSAA